MPVTKILGAEHDVALTNATIQALREHGADEEDRNWALAGSQEINTVRFSIKGSPLILEAETYVGLSLTGEALIVEAIASRVRDILK
jgi:hypothetical protein